MTTTAVAAPAIRIRYCRPCRYRLRAEHLAGLLRERFGAAVTLEAGSYGVFKVWVDGRPAFDKYHGPAWFHRYGFGPVPPDEVVLEAVGRALAARGGTPGTFVASVTS